jgi:hypothetical protein
MTKLPNDSFLKMYPRLYAMHDCTGSQGTQWTVALEKNSDTCVEKDGCGVPDISSQCSENNIDRKAQ